MMYDTNTITDSIPIEKLAIAAYEIPTDAPEADGTLEWNSTTLVAVRINAGGKTGMGYTYADAATAFYIDRTLKEFLIGKNALDIPSIHALLLRAIRNNGNCGISMMAVSAIDAALWDLKGRLFELPLWKIWGRCYDDMPVYGSGGFTSYSRRQLQEQFRHWQSLGIGHMKMKIGAEPAKDIPRVKLAREAIGDGVQLMVDANGAYGVREAVDKATAMADFGVTWMEEPVSSDDLAGLRFIRKNLRAPVRIAAGEYGYNLPYFQTMLQSGAVDVIQADATRCGGLTGFIKAAHLAEAFQVPLSSHCAPALHLQAAVCLPSFSIAEYFHDHARIEALLFEGVSLPQEGVLRPDPDRPGLGIELREKDASRYKL